MKNRSEPGRFIVLGLPRSGSTYLMTLLNAHPLVHCSGEQFNPYGIVGVGEKNGRKMDLWARDAAPLVFLKDFFASAVTKYPDAAWLGYKFMVGHNVRVLRTLAEDPDLHIIYIWRRNKLAQVSSLIKAVESKRWAQNQADTHVLQKIDAGPLQISHRWHEYATFDTLMPPFLEALPNRVLQLEYSEMFKDGFRDRLCRFLNLEADPQMESPLIKQGSNRILDRFQEPKPIEDYFRKLGYANWLEEEL